MFAAVFPTPTTHQNAASLRLQSLCAMPAEGDRERILVGFTFFKTASLEKTGFVAR
jgi:hypothetical protein